MAVCVALRSSVGVAKHGANSGAFEAWIGATHFRCGGKVHV